MTEKYSTSKNKKRVSIYNRKDTLNPEILKSGKMNRINGFDYESNKFFIWKKTSFITR